MDKDLRFFLMLVGAICGLMVIGGFTLDIIDHINASRC